MTTNKIVNDDNGNEIYFVFQLEFLAVGSQTALRLRSIVLVILVPCSRVAFNDFVHFVLFSSLCSRLSHTNNVIISLYFDGGNSVCISLFTFHTITSSPAAVVVIVA